MNTYAQYDLTEALPMPLTTVDQSGYSWFKFSHIEFLLDPRISTLKLIEQGALLRLMAHAGRQVPFGSLPNDPDLLCAMVGLTLTRWHKIADVVMGAAFVRCSDDRWYCPLMIDALDEQSDSCQAAVKVLEKHIQQHFYQHLTSYLPSATVATVSVNPKHQPDGFVMLPKVCSPIPVEVKLNLFNFKAERQLRRYMQEYNAPIGIAVAPRFYDESATDIIYIKIEKNEVLI